MGYTEFKKLAGNTGSIRPGSTSMNFKSPMGPKRIAKDKPSATAQFLENTPEMERTRRWSSARASESSATSAIADTGNAWQGYMRDYEQRNNGQLPTFVKKNDKGQYFVERPTEQQPASQQAYAGKVPGQAGSKATSNTQPSPTGQPVTVSTPATTSAIPQRGYTPNPVNARQLAAQEDFDYDANRQQQQASNNIFDKNTFNNDRINNIKDPAQLDAYMDFVLKGGFGAQQLQDTDYDLSKMTIADIANNPNAISGLSDALENSSQEARESFLRVTKQYQEAMSNKGGDATNSGNGNATASTSGAGSMSQENMDQIKGSFLKGAWNDIKKDPIGMLPQIASMFLKYIGAGDGIANFFKNPWGFYLSLAGILLGGTALLTGGGEQQQPNIVINNGGSQVDPRMAQVPY